MPGVYFLRMPWFDTRGGDRRARPRGCAGLIRHLGARLRLAILLLLVGTATLDGAVTVGAATTGSNGGVAASAFTLAGVVVAAGNDRMLLVLVHSKDATDANRVVLGVTYGGVALSKAQ